VVLLDFLLALLGLSRELPQASLRSTLKVHSRATDIRPFNGLTRPLESLIRHLKGLMRSLRGVAFVTIVWASLGRTIATNTALKGPYKAI
jgi:pimeloyl-ACP methyl ester carboxylesterase